MFSRSFWRGKFQSLKSRPNILRRTSRRTVSTQFISRDIGAQQAESDQVVSLAVNASSYTVHPGDTFTSIASKVGMTVDAIEAANPGVNPASLQVGQILKLQPSGSMYIIVSGDTLSSIAAKTGSSVAALQAANPGINPNNLQVGAQITVPSNNTSLPQPTSPPPISIPVSSGSYKIQAGDTFYAIAKKLGIDEAALEKANPNVNIRDLQVGSQITLPQALPAPVLPQPAPVPAPIVPTPTSGSTYTIQSGDSFYSIAAKFGTTPEILEAANPSLNPLDLHIGSQMLIPTGSSLVPAPVPAPVPTPTPTPVVSPGTYTIQKGDTFTILAAKYGISVEAIKGANPNVIPTNLEVGQVINIPTGSIPIVVAPTPIQPTPVPTPATPVETPSTSGAYIIQAGDTLVSIAAKFGVTLEVLEAANPTIIPHLIKIGQILNLPTGAAPIANSSGAGIGGGFVAYSGPASNFPSPSLWAPYPALWAQNAALMSYSDSPSEIAAISSAITTVSAESGIDPRIILCIIMQESGGNVRVGNTFNGVNNTGIMQAFDGASFNPADPAGSILQMVRDGTEGTARGDGLKQNFAQTGNWYEAARKYNSGSVDKAELNNALGATTGYVVGFANRIMGHSWPNM